MSITVEGDPSPGRVGDSYLTRLSAVGGAAPYRWAITRGVAPTGLLLDENGRISGVPGADGIFTFVVHVTDTQGITAEREFSIPIDSIEKMSRPITFSPNKVSPKSMRAERNTISGSLTLGWLTLAAGAIIFGIVSVSSTAVSDRTLLLAVALVGSAGGCLSAVAAVSSYVMNRAFQASWTAYFIFRPLIGSALSTLVYFAIRAGIVSSNAPVSSINHYGILVVSFAAGLFSKNALDKIFEVNDIIYSRSSGLSSEISRKRHLPPSIRELDSYRGFIVYQIRRGSVPGSWFLQIWLQSGDPPDLESYELNIGEGSMPATVRFRFTVFQHDYQSVTPQSATVEVKNDDDKSEAIIFQFTGSDETEHPPVALIEVSQHGRTVAVVSTDDSHA
jgi:hypothetical protein